MPGCNGHSVKTRHGEAELKVSTISDIEVEAGSGNIFADLGLAEPEEALAKAELAFAISTILARRRLSQTRAAAVLGIDQPKVSALVRGRLSGFSLERLLRFLQALQQDVEIIIKPVPRPRTRGRLKVLAATSGRARDEDEGATGRVQARSVAT